MLNHSTTLAPIPNAISGIVAAGTGRQEGVGLALFRAREVLEAGWQLTPDEALARTGDASKLLVCESGRSARACLEMEAEDEVDDVALFFSES